MSTDREREAPSEVFAARIVDGGRIVRVQPGTEAWEALVERAVATAYANEMERISRTPAWAQEMPAVQSRWRETISRILRAALGTGDA